MKRDGDRVIFDSETQLEQFEAALLRLDGVELFITQLFEAIGRAHRAAEAQWKRVRDGVQLAPGETLVWGWQKRELRIRAAGTDTETSNETE